MNVGPRVGTRFMARAFAHYLGCVGLLVGSLAFAADYPLTGTVTVNGNSSTLPSGGAFVGSSYDLAGGTIGTGALVFPQATVDFDFNGQTATATYQLSQTNTSSGQVWSDGTAGLSTATLKLEVLTVTVAGFPLSVAPCIFAPIDVVLAGTASSSGLVLSDEGFTVPPVASTDCAGFGDEINAELAGNANSLEVNLAGDFTPPTNDTIFSNGFETTTL